MISSRFLPLVGWRIRITFIALLISSCAQTSGTTVAPQTDTPPAPTTVENEADNEGWPREIPTSKGTIVIYQPQPEKLDGDKLSARAAIAIEIKGEDEPVYGAVWIDARLATDRTSRTATITELSVTQIRLPEKVEKHSDGLSNLLEQEIPKWDLPISMDRLLTSLDLAETRSQASEKINNNPPQVLFSTEPAVLISIDGEPRLQPVEGSNLMRVINTPFTILLDQSSSTYYLNADATNWYQASDILGAWSLTEQVPEEVADRAPKAEPGSEEQNDDEAAAEPGPPPKIIVATKPTELIVSNGEPEFTPIEGTGLLYMSSTDTDLLLDTQSQQYYVLLAGRWYTSKHLESGWNYVDGKDLPPDFSKIPEDSDMATVLYSIPGTELSKEAVLDANVPQTAKIDRNKATLKVTYDGDPKFEPVASTNMQYAVNSETPVIKVDGKYYAVDDGVWFVADKATGPWQVATSVPTEIYTIEPDSPLYHVTFVRIYKVTPEYVYVGYTPGYTNTYVYNSTIVYGTGYWYPGWYGTYYYPRPATWGFSVRYNPWSGWGFGFSYSNGPFTFGVGFGGWYRGGWWGPSRYHGYNRGYRHGYRNGYNAGYRAGNYRGNQQNLYRNHGNAWVPGEGRTKAVRESGRRTNNVYADRQGQVHQKTQQGWQTRSDGNWQASDANVRQSQNLQRSTQTRQRGTNRAGAYRQARGGGGRGGGGRRGP